VLQEPTLLFSRTVIETASKETIKKQKFNIFTVSGKRNMLWRKMMRILVLPVLFVVLLFVTSVKQTIKDIMTLHSQLKKTYPADTDGRERVIGQLKRELQQQ
jgi:hypothetical protein